MLAVVLPFAIGCSDKDRIAVNGPDLFSLNDAKAVYENEVLATATRASSSTAPKSKLSPGEFTPLWDEAEAFRDKDVIGYTVPIYAERNIYSYRRTPDNIIHRPWRRVRQELVVTHNLSSGKQSAVIKSTIKRYGLKTTEKYSGVVTYTLLGRGQLIGIEEYANGAITDAVMKGDNQGHISISKARKMLEGYSFAFKRNSPTRSDDDEDDPWGDDPWEWSFYEDGTYIDENGDVWIDTDLDGVPDFYFGNIGMEDWFWDDDEPYFTPGSSFVPKSTTRLAFTGVPTSASPAQYSFTSSCFLSVMQYGAALFGSNFSQWDFLCEYIIFADTTLSDVYDEGLDPVTAKRLARDSFDYTYRSSRSAMRQAVNAGHVLLAVVKDTCDEYHAITIIGYDTSNHHFIYINGDDGLAYEETVSGGILIPALEFKDFILEDN